MAMCEICSKRRRAGKNVSHSNRHTNRWFFPNVQRAVIVVKGKRQRVSLCTRCLRTARTRSSSPDPAPTVSPRSGLLPHGAVD